MMVTCEDEPIPSDAPLAPILTKLKKEEFLPEERVHMYSSLAEEFQKEDISATLQTLGQEAQTLTTRFCEDIQNDQKELNQSALRVLGLCLHYEETAKSFSEGDSKNILTALCNTVLKTEDKSTCTRALWCLSRQQLPSSVIKSELHNILCALEHVLRQAKFQSVTAEYEAVNLLIRLLEQLPDVMTSFTIRWAPMLFPLMVHSAHKLREKAHQATQLALPAMRKHQTELAPLLVVALKSTIIVDMAELFTNKQEHYVLHVWKLYMDLLGKALHKGGSLINLMLRVVEQGFKHGFPEIKRESFQAWKTLIDNFALDLDVLSNAKRLKLLMQPFLATSTKQESVAIAKFDAWWHLCIALGPRLASNFEVVLAPLLQFCLGFTHSASYPRNSTPSSASSRHSFQSVHHSGGLKALAMTSPATTPRMTLSSPSRSGGEPFKSLIIRGAVVLSYLLSCQEMEVNCQHLRLQINDPPQPLAVPVLSRGAMVFIKIAAHLIPIVKDTIQHHRIIIGDEICVEMFSALTQHVKTALENTQKKDNGEMFGSFLSHLQDIVKDSEIQPSMLLKFMDSLKGLPTKVLGSSAYLSWTAGCVLHGTPTLFLLELLFSPQLLKASSDERYFLLLEHLVACGMSNQSSVLEFTSSYMSLLDKVAVSDFSNKEILWRMWSVLASPLLDHIMMTNEVNQGDSFEHDFSALISCLIFPIQKILPFGIPLPTTKTLLKTWTDLYQAFTRCAAMVTTAGENQCCQDLCSKIVDLTVDENVHLNLPFLETLFQILRVMLDSVDFSVYTNQQAGLQSPVTPGKWGKKRHKPLRNLSSFVKLLSHMMYSFHKQRACQAITFLGNTNQAYLSSWTTIVSNCCHIVTALFSHISRTSILQQLISKLTKPLSGFYGDKTNFPSNELYKTNLLPKLDKLWQDILMGIQARFPGPYDSESLEVFEPIFDATLSSPHRSIRNHTLLFWSATFAKADSLKYSERMKICLQKVQEKNVALPGWSDVEIVDSTDSTSPSLLAPPTLSPSPRKIHGSFLQRPEQAKQLFISSSPFKSPGKSPLQSKNTSSPAKEKLPARRRLHIEEENTQDFVFIAPSPKKKQALTEHQKEMLKEKRVIPALYNDLEQSQDTELFSDLTQTQSQFPDRLSEKRSAASPEKKSTTLMDAFTALKEAEAANAEGEKQTSPPKKPVLDKKVTFSEEHDNNKPKADKGSDYFVAKMNEKIQSLKKAIQKGIKESVTSDVTVTVIDETPEPLAARKIENQTCQEDGELMEVTGNESMETKTENDSEKVEAKFGGIVSGESVSVIPETQTDLTEKSSVPIAEILSSPLDSILKTPPKNESFPFQVDEEFDLTNITIPDDQVSPFVKISTPVVKVHKLDMTKFQTRHTLEVEKSKMDKIRKAGQTTPIITPSPTGGQTPQETPRFRRYKSDEIHTRSLRSGGKVRKWHSFEDLNPESPKEEFSPVGPDTSVFSLHSPSSGIISDKADLDGILPLDCSFDHDEVEKEIVELAEKEVRDSVPECFMKKEVVEQTPTLRRGKRQRKVKEFSDFITPQKLLSTILPSQENSCEDQPECDNGSQDVTEDLEDEKRREIEDLGKDKDEGKVSGNEVCEKLEETSQPWESTQELFTAEESMEEESAEDETGTQEDEGKVVDSKLSGDVVEAVLKEDVKEESEESSKGEKESPEGKLEGRLEDENSNDEKPLSSLRGRKRKKLRRKRKAKSESVETINLCNSQSQDAVGHKKFKENGSVSQNETEKNVNGEGQKSGGDMNLKEVQLGAAEDKECGITDAVETKAVSPKKKRRKKSQTVDVESSLEGKEEPECKVESDGDCHEIHFGQMEKGDESGAKKEIVVPGEEKKNDADETVLEMEESVEAEETSFNSDDEIPLMHLQKSIGDADGEKASQDAKEVEMCSVTDKRCNEEEQKEEANTGEEGISKKKGGSVPGEDAQKVTKGSNNRRQKSGRQRHPISPKIRRNLTERFQKAKQISPKSNQLQTFVLRKKPTKHSPKMLRSKGPIGTLNTRLRSKGDNSQTVPLKKNRILKKKRKGKEKSKLLRDAGDVNGAKVIIGVTNEAKETVPMTTEVKEVEAIVCPNQESVAEKQSNIVSNGGENVSNTGMVSMETDITHSVSLTSNDRDMNDSESAQTIGKESINTSQTNDSVGEAGNKEQHIENSSKEHEKEPECLQNTQKSECKAVAGSELSSKGKEDIINSSCTATKLAPGREDIEEGNTGSAMHAGNLPLLDGEGSELKAGSDGSNSPVIRVKFMSRLCSSPVAANKVLPSGERSPEFVGVGSIYSPSVSPSNGILKKKDDTGSNSPSPTNKNRRVKFSDKVSTKEIENCTPSRSSNKQRLVPGSPSSGRGRTSSTLHPSPLVTTTPSRVVNLQSKYITTPSRTADDRNERLTNSSSRRVTPKFKSHSHRYKSSKSHRGVQPASLTPPTQGTRSSQLNSSLDEEGECQESIFPELLDCKAPVEEILPQLTSSMWSRGLGQLVRARNIFTIGQLSALTPSEVQSLPIRSPKVSHLKWVLGQYLQRLQTKTSDEAGETQDANPQVSGENSKSEEESTAETSISSTSLKRKRGNLQEAPESLSEPDAKKTKLVEQLEKLSEDLNVEVLRSVSPQQLFKAHSHINSLMDSIMGVLKSKYQSSPSTS